MLVKAQNKRSINKALVCALLVGTAITVIGSSAPANAQQVLGEAVSVQQTNFNISEQSLSSALTLFGQQSGLQISVDSAVARGLSSSGVSGVFSDEEALARLLAGTGISYYFSGADTVIIAAESTTTVFDDNSLVLDTIVVTAPDASSGSGFQGAPDWIYESPTSTSVIAGDALRRVTVRDSADLFEGMPGVHTADNPQNPAVNVSIRGLLDRNRITSTIDGARQNFQREAHGTTDYVFIDPSLISSVEVEKSGTAEAGGAASLGGSVNFRTIGVNDLIEPGELVGGELNLSAGTNAHNFTGSLSGAAIINDSFSILGAVSFKNVGDYMIGQNGTVVRSDSVVDITDGVDYTELEMSSLLFKAETRPADDMTLDLGWLHYGSDFWYGSGDLISNDNFTNDTLTAKYHWDPEDSLIDLKVDAWYNNTQGDQYRPQGASGRTYGDYQVQYGMESFGGTVQNTSRFEFPEADLSVNYGVEAFRDQTNVTSQALATGTSTQNQWFSGYNPVGTRDVVSTFANATLDYDEWLTLAGGLRYDYYNIRGSSRQYEGYIQKWKTVTSTTCEKWVQAPYPYQACTKAEWDFFRTFFQPLLAPWPAGRPVNGLYPQIQAKDGIERVWRDVDVQSSGGKLLPTATIAVKPFEGFQIFAKYSEGYRPPVLAEAVLGGEHIGGSASGATIYFYPNPNLKPEHSQTWEIGANYSQDGVLFPEDHLRMKGVVFARAFTNRIVGEIIPVSTTSTGLDVTITDGSGYVNLDGVRNTWGVELEASYDAGFAYIGGSYTYLNSDYVSATLSAPEHKASIDAGVRLLDSDLTFGGRVSLVSDDIRDRPDKQPAYAKFDLYGSYAFNDKATVSLAIDNVTDLAYTPPLGNPLFPAPGRTITLSLRGKL